MRAVVVTGAGRAFCAGMDLSREGNVFGLDESLAPTPEEFRAHYDEPPYHDGLRDTGGRVTLAIYALPKPVIAAINGAAVGIGATMTLGMDIRMASTEARIGFVFGRIGITPEAASSWFLPRIVGCSRRSSGSTPPTSSPPRPRWPDGWCARCTRRRSCCRRRRSWPGRSSRSLTRRARAGQAAALPARGAAEPLEAHLSDSLGVYWTSLSDGKEGVAAFLEKRPASFTGKASELPRID